MHVAIVVERSWKGLTPSGGAETMMKDLAVKLVERGHQVTVLICTDSGIDATIDGVRVLSPDKETFHREVKGSDIVMTQLGGTPRGRLTARSYGVPVVQLIHNTSEYTVGFLAEGCDLAIYNSHWVKEFHEAHKSDFMIKSWQHNKLIALRTRQCFNWDSVVVRPPVIDKELKTIRTNPLKRSVTLINLIPNKGPDVFYRLAELNPDIHFMGVIGGYQPEDQDIRDLPNVTIHDHVDDVAEIYNKTAILLVPSIYESYGRVAVEAMQYGIPVIANPTPGLSECLGDAGVYCPRDDINSWHEALHDTLKNYDERRLQAHARYTELAEMADTDLEAYAEAMEGLADEHNLNRGT